MSVSHEFENEYTKLLERRQFIIAELPKLPQGYISKKVIKGKLYYYLQHRINGKITGQYLKNDDAGTVADDIERRKKYETELPIINARIKELDRAASLIGKTSVRKLTLLKLSSGMDDLTPGQKNRSTSFANALNAVEGVAASEQTTAEINDWQSGQKTYIAVFKSVLQRYGFPSEV